MGYKGLRKSPGTQKGSYKSFGQQGSRCTYWFSVGNKGVDSP